MVLFNYSTRELTAKIVYYGPGLCGKTTNLQYIHENLPETVKGKMLSLATKTDRTLFFDFLPIDLGEIRGMKTRVQLYTVPGQVFYNETRKLVLKGADGIVFVADSQEQMLGANVESFKNLEENLKSHGMRLGDMPHVIQFNKRDLPKLSSIEDLNNALNRFNAPFYESVATTGIGVQDTLKAIVKLVLLHLTKKYDPKAAPAQVAAPPPAPAVVAAAPPPSRPSISRPAIPPTPVLNGPPSAGRSGSIPVSAMPDPFPSRPTSRMAAVEPQVPVAAAAPPMATVPAAAPPAMPPPAEFDDAEIDSLMSEVDAAPAPLVAPPEPAWTAEEDDGVWMGSPDEDAIMSRTSPDALEEALERTDDEGDPDLPSAAAQPAAASPEDRDITFDTLSFEPDRADADAPIPLEPIVPDAPSSGAPLSVWSEAAAAGPVFEIDRGFDPDWGTSATEPIEAIPPSPPLDLAAPIPQETIPGPVPSDRTVFSVPDEAIPVAPAAPADDDAIVLSEVVEDDALFEDPTLEIARLEPAEVREIVVPVLLGDGPAARRFKLSIRLRLDPVD